MGIGPSEAETFWIVFLCKLKRRRRNGVKRVISDTHGGIKAGVAHVFQATWQQCRVPFFRTARVHAGKSGRPVVVAFAQDDAGAARGQRRQVADPVGAELHSTNPVDRLNGEIKCRTEFVGIPPNHDAITRLIGAKLSEQNDEWAVPRARCITWETIAPLGDDPVVKLPAVAGPVVPAG